MICDQIMPNRRSSAIRCFSRQSARPKPLISEQMRGPRSLRRIPSEDPADEFEELGLLFSGRDGSDEFLERIVGDWEVVEDPVACNCQYKKEDLRT